MKKNGFTLAEVLITLGIIGVVAAITIPGLITEHQKRATVTKLQRAISVINQAYKMSFDDVGEPEDAMKLGANEYFNTYWAPYIKTAILCTNYKVCGYDSIQPFKSPNGTTNMIQGITASSAEANNRVAFYTADGFVFMISIATTLNSADGTTVWIPDYKIRVDINGRHKPNIYGKDVFILTRVTEDGGGVQPYGYQKTDNAIKQDCSKEGYGLTCAERIRRAGWEIEKNYPW